MCVREVVKRPRKTNGTLRRTQDTPSASSTALLFLPVLPRSPTPLRQHKSKFRLSINHYHSTHRCARPSESAQKLQCTSNSGRSGCRYGNKLLSRIPHPRVLHKVHASRPIPPPAHTPTQQYSHIRTKETQHRIP